MRELLVLIRYALPRRKLSGLPGFLIGFGLTMIFLFVLWSPLYRSVINQFGYEVFLAFFSLGLTVFSILFLFGYVFNLSYSLLNSEEIEFLLTLPLRRGTIALFQSIQSAYFQFLQFSILLFNVSFSSYLLRDWVVFFTGILQIVFLMSVGNVLSFLFSRTLTKSTARIVFVVIQLLSVFTFLLFLNIDLVRSASISLRFILSDWNLFALPALSYKKPFHLLTSLTFVVFTVLASFFVGERVLFEPVTGKAEKKKPRFGFLKGFYAKDMKVLLREERMIYLVFYPVGFGIILALFGGKDDMLGSIMIVLAISILYNSTMAALLWRYELLTWPIFRTFPADAWNLLKPKILLPSLLNGAVFLAFTVFLTLYTGDPLYLLLNPFVFVVYVLSAILGVTFLKVDEAAKNPSNPARIFSLQQILLVEAVSMGFAIVLFFSLKLIREMPIVSIVGLFGVPITFSLIVRALKKHLVKRIELFE